MSLKDAPVQEESVGDAHVQEESVGDNPMVTVVDPAPIVANLDAPADDDPDDNYDDDDDDDDTENDTGIMPKYIKAIQNRIRHENSSVGVEGWLMEYLRKHDWWIRANAQRNEGLAFHTLATMIHGWLIQFNCWFKQTMMS